MKKYVHTKEGRERMAKVIALLDQGYSYKDIAEKMGTSRQRIHQVITQTTGRYKINAAEIKRLVIGIRQDRKKLRKWRTSLMKKMWYLRRRLTRMGLLIQEKESRLED